MARISLYIPDELKTRMDALDGVVNWSEIARPAFMSAVSGVELPASPHETDPPLTPADEIARLEKAERTAIAAIHGWWPTDPNYQTRVGQWLLVCFGPEIPFDKTERNHRFLEEALETVQAAGCTRSEAHQLVGYVYGRDVGDLRQEVGGVMNTLAALCLAHGLDMDEAGEAELARCWDKIEKIRAKQAAKPKHSPLPEHGGIADKMKVCE